LWLAVISGVQNFANPHCEVDLPLVASDALTMSRGRWGNSAHLREN